MAPKKRSRSEEQKQQRQPSTTSSRVLRSSTTNKTPTAAPIVITKKKVATPAKKKPKTKDQSPVEKAAAPALEPHEAPKTIVIEHCKQCNQFKTRAIKVKEALENGIAGITVLVNPEKPRRGCFEVREDGGEIFISLLDMKRPFSPMRALDMDKVIYDIIDKIKK